MQNLAIAAVATAVFVGAGAGAVSHNGTPQSMSDQFNPMIEGQAIAPDEALIDGISQSPEHKAFAAALKGAHLDAVLKSAGPFTVFAPTDTAFAKLQPGTPMARTMRYAIVTGRYDSQSLLKLINDGGGQARLPTLEGGMIVATLNGPTNIALMDEEGNFANISIYDIIQSNGVLQVVDRVLLPKGGERRLATR